MDSRRSFLKKAALLSGSAGLAGVIPASIQKALAIDPTTGSDWTDAEHIVFLMQENRSFDHCFGNLQGVRGFNDPRAIDLPNKNPVWLQTNANGETYAPFRMDINKTKATWMGALPHSWENQADARNSGKYDRWLDVKQPGDEEYKNLPMTLGYYTREDIPFYYALADAFTVCDQHFCSSITGTTPNRLYFWTGKIREDEHSKARVRNGDTDYESNASWTTFPERLEANDISWKIYQNELSVGVGFSHEEDAWLGNFTDNPLEWFTQYNVKLSTGYIEYLQTAPQVIAVAIEELTKKLQTVTGKKGKIIQQQLDRKKRSLEQVKEDKKIYTRERYEQLTDREKKLHDKAFTTNRQDAFYHQLTSLQYSNGDREEKLVIPKGDVLHQFRNDVSENKLPTVSWLIAPENFSDHPTAPWYGAWYVSEVLDILTSNPETWKKTIFVLTYDENDGYFDHIPPFVVPHPNKRGTGLTSEGINVATEYVLMKQELQEHSPEESREGPIGLGYRVPLVIASPWSRGGWVNSEVFDHTSSLQFLEKFIQKKYGKNIQETNISNWRRAICGDLSSVFRSYNNEKITMPVPIEKNSFIETVHKAKFNQLPSGYAPLAPAVIAQIKKGTTSSSWLPQQEKGVRSSNALPYELYVDGNLNVDKKIFAISFAAGNKVFGDQSAGSPFNVYAPGNYAVYEENEHRQSFDAVKTWAYAVSAGDQLNDQWPVEDFENGLYHLRVYGPNGFFREFSGNKKDPEINVTMEYERMEGNAQKLTGNIILSIRNFSNKTYTVDIEDTIYRNSVRTIVLEKPGVTVVEIVDLTASFNWYDVSIKVRGNSLFEKRYAGRVETGRNGKTDPHMGKVKLRDASADGFILPTVS